MRRSRTSFTLSFSCARQAGNCTTPESSSEEEATADDFAEDLGNATSAIRGFGSKGTDGLGNAVDGLDSVDLDDAADSVSASGFGEILGAGKGEMLRVAGAAAGLALLWRARHCPTRPCVML